MVRWKLLGYLAVVWMLFALAACNTNGSPQTQVNQTRTAPIVALAENQDAKPMPQVRRASGSQIEGREPTRVSDIKIVGNTVTRDNVIRRQLNLYPGQVLSYPDLVESQRNLQRLGIFAEVTVEVENPEVNQSHKCIVVKVKENPSSKLSIEVSSSAAP